MTESDAPAWSDLDGKPNAYKTHMIIPLNEVLSRYPNGDPENVEKYIKEEFKPAYENRDHNYHFIFVASQDQRNDLLKTLRKAVEDNLVADNAHVNYPKTQERGKPKQNSAYRTGRPLALWLANYYTRTDTDSQQGSEGMLVYSKIGHYQRYMITNDTNQSDKITVAATKEIDTLRSKDNMDDFLVNLKQFTVNTAGKTVIIDGMNVLKYDPDNFNEKTRKNVPIYWGNLDAVIKCLLEQPPKGIIVVIKKTEQSDKSEENEINWKKKCGEMGVNFMHQFVDCENKSPTADQKRTMKCIISHVDQILAIGRDDLLVKHIDIEFDAGLKPSMEDCGWNDRNNERVTAKYRGHDEDDDLEVLTLAAESDDAMIISNDKYANHINQYKDVISQKVYPYVIHSEDRSDERKRCFLIPPVKEDRSTDIEYSSANGDAAKMLPDTTGTPTQAEDTTAPISLENFNDRITVVSPANKAAIDEPITR